MPRLTVQPEILSLADEYVRALYDLAEQAHQTDVVEQELDELAKVLEQVPGLEDFLDSPFIPAEKKLAAMAKALDHRVSELTDNFLGVLIRNGRGGVLGVIARRYRHLGNQRSGRMDVTVISATPLDEDQKQQIIATLRDFLHAEPLLNLEVDETLLGGLRVMVGDDILDASLQTQLKRLRQEMMKRPAHRRTHET